MAGQIIPRGKRTFLVRVFLGRDPSTGKRLYHNKTIHGGRKDAEAYLTGMLRDRDLGVVVPTKATVGVLLDELLADYRINRKRLDWARIVVEKHLRPFFGKLPIERVGTATITEYIASRQQAGRSNSTVNRELALLRRAFNLGRIASPPKVVRVPHIPSFQENNVRKGFFEHDEFLAMRRALPEEIRPILTFAYYTGCRRGEIMTLTWSQVDLAERLVRLDPGTTKNDEARMIPLAGDLCEMLAMRKAARDREHPECPWVFFRDGERIRDFRAAWVRACREAGLANEQGNPTRIFHDLRRTGVRNLVRAGVPERVVMAISGHKTRAVFDRYNIVSESDLKTAAARLGDYFRDKGASAASRHTIGTQTQSRPSRESVKNRSKLLN
jgi:integrase